MKCIFLYYDIVEYHTLTAIKENGTEVYDVVKFLEQRNRTFATDKIDSIELSFALNGIRLKASETIGSADKPDCVDINATVSVELTLSWRDQCVDINATVSVELTIFLEEINV